MSTLRAFLLRLDRKIAWILIPVTLLILTSGYLLARTDLNPYLMNRIHIRFQWAFMSLFLYHFYVTIFLIDFPWKDSIKKILSREAQTLTYVKLIQNVTALILLATGLWMFLSGLGWLSLNFLSHWLPFQTHLQYDFYFVLALIIHTGAGIKSLFIRRGIKNKKVDLIVYSITLSILLAVIYLEFS